MGIDYDHEQVEFIDFDGMPTTVDAGLIDIMELLLEHRVQTQYSCEDNMGQAYVIADRKSFKQLERRIWRSYFSRRYSPRSRQVARDFFRGRHEYDFALYLTRPETQRTLFRVLFERGGAKSKSARYTTERIFNNYRGLRTSFRWPPADSEALRCLLAETKR